MYIYMIYMYTYISNTYVPSVNNSGTMSKEALEIYMFCLDLFSKRPSLYMLQTFKLVHCLARKDEVKRRYGLVV